MLKIVNALMCLFMTTLLLSKSTTQMCTKGMEIQTPPSKLQTFPKFIDVIINTSFRIVQNWVIDLNGGT
jgi:hypothetical protein